MTDQPEVTVTKWTTGLDHFGDRVYDSRGTQVAMARNADRAAHIVRCVNAHDGLVEALELILHSFDDGPPSMQFVRLDDACKNAQAVLAALAAAKEGA